MPDRSLVQESTMTAYRSYVGGRKTYWREASVVMACITFNAMQERDGDHWFDATWEQKWWGGKVLTLRENFRA